MFDSSLSGPCPRQPLANGSDAPTLLASTWDSAGAQHDLSLDACPALASLLAGTGRYFVVASRAWDEQGQLLLAVDGDLAFGPWLMNCPMSTPGSDCIVILKSCNLSVKELVATPSMWSQARLLNTDVAAVQARLMAACALICAGACSDPGVYKYLDCIIDSPDWNGLIVLNPVVSQLPCGVGPVMADQPGGALPVVALGLSWPSDMPGGTAFAAIDCHGRRLDDTQVSLKASFANDELVFLSIEPAAFAPTTVHKERP